MDWPTTVEAVAIAGLPPSVATDPAFVEALDAAQAECVRLAPRRFLYDDTHTATGPDDQDSWYAVCKAAAVEFRGRSGPGPVGYTETGQLDTTGGSDGWQDVRRLLGIGFYAPPRAR